MAPWPASENWCAAEFASCLKHSTHPFSSSTASLAFDEEVIYSGLPGFYVLGTSLCRGAGYPSYLLLRDQR